MQIAIGVFGANKEQICFLNSCGIIFKQAQPEQFENFTHIILFNQKARRKFIKTIMSQDEQIDIFTWSKTLNGKFFSHEVKNNITFITCLIPMELNKKSLVVRKGFCFERKKLPAEEIPLMDKGGLQRLFLTEMKKLFHSQNLPFAVKSFSPDPEKIPFLFRIDTDFCDKKTIENYYENIKKGLSPNKLKTSWFVHCKTYENSAELFLAGESDEFALHCFSHKVKPTNENLKKGIEILKKFGKKPFGYSAPYGIRNEKSDAFLRENFDFEYSSDFSFAADALPFFVEKTGLWQIPIFPLCIGSFNSVSNDEEKIAAVFERYFARNFKYKIPFIIYDHPNHKKFDLLNKIFAAANKYPILPMTFLEYCEFLKKRENSGDDFPVLVFYPPAEPEHNKENHAAAQIKKISRFSLRLIKNTIINRLRRRKHDKF